MFFKKEKKASSNNNSSQGVNWTKLSKIEQLNEVDVASEEKPIVIFKHSTRCSISSSALNRLERNWTDEGNKKFDAYFLDLISFREVSNAIAHKYQVMHESPQVIVIKNGKAIYNNSHMGINYNELLAL